jgi:hypothetical protein
LLGRIQRPRRVGPSPARYDPLKSLGFGARGMRDAPRGRYAGGNELRVPPHDAYRIPADSGPRFRGVWYKFGGAGRGSGYPPSWAPRCCRGRIRTLPRYRETRLRSAGRTRRDACRRSLGAAAASQASARKWFVHRGSEDIERAPGAAANWPGGGALWVHGVAGRVRALRGRCPTL